MSVCFHTVYFKATQRLSRTHECVCAGQDTKSRQSGNILDKFKLPILQPHLSPGNRATTLSLDLSPMHSPAYAMSMKIKFSKDYFNW